MCPITVLVQPPLDILVRTPVAIVVDAVAIPVLYSRMDGGVVVVAVLALALPGGIAGRVGRTGEPVAVVVRRHHAAVHEVGVRIAGSGG